MGCAHPYGEMVRGDSAMVKLSLAIDGSLNIGRRPVDSDRYTSGHEFE